MTTTVNYKVTINGTDVSYFLKDGNADDTVEEIIDKARLIFLGSLRNFMTLNSGQEVTIQRGPDSDNLRYIFRGYIESWTMNNGYIDMECPNKLWKLSQQEVTTSYDKDVDVEAGILSEIMIDLVTDGGMSADSTTIPDSTSYQGERLRSFICRSDNRLERIETLANILGWRIRYNPVDDKVYITPEGYTTHVTTLRVGMGVSNYIRGMPVVERDFSQIINVIKVTGAKQFQENIVQSFTASVGQTRFELDNTPEGTKVTIDAAVKTRGARDQTGSFDYYVDQPNNSVVTTSAMAGGEAVVVTYSANVPTDVIVKDSYSIQNYTDNEERQKTFPYNDIVSVADAEMRALKLKEDLSSPAVKYQVRILPSIPIVLAGMKMNIEDDFNDIEAQYVVRAVNRRYPDFEDVVTFANRPLLNPNRLESIAMRLEKLEKEATRNQGVLRHTFPNQQNIEVQKRCGHFYKKATSASIGIWGNAASNWGTAKWGHSSATEVLTQVWQGDNVYREHCYDALFIDEGATTATLNTSLRRFE